MPKTPAIPERMTAVLKNGIEGIGFSYIDHAYQNDNHWLVSELLWRGVRALALELKALGVVRVIHQGTYNPRKVTGGNAWSNHAYGCSIDLWGFRMIDGTIVKVSDYTKNNKHPLIADVIKICRRLFKECLTPDTNKAHADHIHCGYRGEHYAEDKAKYLPIVTAIQVVENTKAADGMIAKKILVEQVWGNYPAKADDAGTRVRNRITQLVKAEYGLE